MNKSLDEREWTELCKGSNCLRTILSIWKEELCPVLHCGFSYRPFSRPVPRHEWVLIFLKSHCTKRLDVAQDQLTCGSIKTSSGNWQGTETYMVRACHAPWQPLKNHSSGTLEWGRRRGRQMKCWMDNIKEWTYLPMPELLTRAPCREDCRRISAESSLMPPDDPVGQETELNSALYTTCTIFIPAFGQWGHKMHFHPGVCKNSGAISGGTVA